MHGNILPTLTGQAPTLHDLAATVRTYHAAVVSALGNAVEQAIKCGTALTAAKKQAGHGRWLEFLRACDINDRTARRYIQLAELAKTKSVAATDLTNMSIEGAIKHLAPSKLITTKAKVAKPPKLVAPVVTSAAIEPKAKAKHTDIIAAWLGASPEDRTRAIDSIGLVAMMTAMPPDWLPLLEADRRQPSVKAVTDPALSIPADLVIPDFMKRAVTAHPAKDKSEQAEIAPVKVTSPLVAPIYDGPSRAYCGPTAIAAITGEPISTACDAVRQASGRITRADGSAWPVAGVANKDLLTAMRLLGWRVAEQWRERKEKGAKPYTLDAFAKDHGHDGPYIVNTTGHYVAVSQGKFCDSVTKLPKDLSADVLDRSWVRSWWRFEKPAALEQTETAR